MAVALRGAVNGVVEKVLREPGFDVRACGEDLVAIFGRAVAVNRCAGLSSSRWVAVAMSLLSPGWARALRQAGHDVAIAAYAPRAIVH
ncbi:MULTISPECIES: hypothetical protein [Mycobacterium]|uniref:Uncharacterized protein n=1 Tax=Mycobacterium colombiense TaxID=339268 RepID=A0A1A0V871_9MYCO|nr:MULTISPECIES: hypothetical protein [Mycobacterium]OBB79386.1 hypothetical protein A5760_20885 [Mycobacterium colombiense]OBB96757.1 hypothetical protein A5782_01115 [Mycobacterium sp. 852002-40037_SCH5390672]